MIVYDKLFDLLEEKGMQKTDLLEIISRKTIAKLSRGDDLSTNAINKICKFLKCQPGDIMEFEVCYSFRYESWTWEEKCYCRSGNLSDALFMFLDTYPYRGENIIAKNESFVEEEMIITEDDIFTEV